MTTQLVVDFKAVAYARFYYKNQYGDTSRTLPKLPSVHAKALTSGIKAVTPDGLVDAVEYARERNLLDKWTPVCVLQLRNNHSLVFTGEKAKQMWKNYNGHIFNKK